MTVTVKTPAKINLTLEILGKREDGFHELRSVIQTISLFDTLVFAESDTTVFQSDSAAWSGEKSLVSRAIDLFRETTGRENGVSVTMTKRIPMMAGLGGDSSDAAATLLALNRLWSAGLSLSELHAMAEKLGSDCPFFLYGGTALLEGRGEIVKPLLPVRKTHLALVIPEIEAPPGKTGRLFAGIGPEQYSDGRKTENFIREMQTGTVLPEIINTFEQVAYSVFYGLDTIRQIFSEVSGRKIHLAGSGPVLFIVSSDEIESEKLVDELTLRGIPAVAAETAGGIIVW